MVKPADAARRDRSRLHEAAEKIANVDGASWIRNQIRGQSLPLDAVGLDFYHLAEHVHQARRAVFGEDDTTGQPYASELLHAYKHDGTDAVWQSRRAGMARNQIKIVIDGMDVTVG